MVVQRSRAQGDAKPRARRLLLVGELGRTSSGMKLRLKKIGRAWDGNRAGEGNEFHSVLEAQPWKT